MLFSSHQSNNSTRSALICDCGIIASCDKKTCKDDWVDARSTLLFTVWRCAYQMVISHPIACVNVVSPSSVTFAPYCALNIRNSENLCGSFVLLNRLLNYSLYWTMPRGDISEAILNTLWVWFIACCTCTVDKGLSMLYKKSEG